MGVKTEDNSSRYDSLIWIVVVGVLAAGFAANYYFPNLAVPLRIAAWLLLLCAAMGVAALTSQGRSAVAFFKAARVEMRKVTWPTRQEALQTTAVVVVIVAITAFVLWGLDALLLWAVAWLTGQRG